MITVIQIIPDLADRDFNFFRLVRVFHNKAGFARSFNGGRITGHRQFLHTVLDHISGAVLYRQIFKCIFPLAILRKGNRCTHRLQDDSNTRRTQTVTVVIIQPFLTHRNVHVIFMISIDDLITVFTCLTQRPCVIHDRLFVEGINDLISFFIILAKVLKFPFPVSGRVCGCDFIDIRIFRCQVNDNACRTVVQCIIITTPGFCTGNSHDVPLIGDRCSIDCREVTRKFFLHRPGSFQSIEQPREFVDRHSPDRGIRHHQFSCNIRINGGTELQNAAFIAGFHKRTDTEGFRGSIELQSVHQFDRSRTIFGAVTFPHFCNFERDIIKGIDNAEPVCHISADLRCVMVKQLIYLPGDRLMCLLIIFRESADDNVPYTAVIDFNNDLHFACRSISSELIRSAAMLRFKLQIRKLVRNAIRIQGQ